jgi:hypothetical protein
VFGASADYRWFSQPSSFNSCCSLHIFIQRTLLLIERKPVPEALCGWEDIIALAFAFCMTITNNFGTTDASANRHIDTVFLYDSQ